MVLLPKPLGGAVRRVWRALRDPYVPWLAHLVVTRRCNLACGYCNEYDDTSLPVPLATLLERLDHLSRLGTVVVTLTGGEPLLHPELHRVVAHAVRRGIVCTAITNGYPLSQQRIAQLNEASLTLLQISIDNVEPNEVSQKSWSRLRSRLELLRDHARFGVNVNAVLGSCAPDETRLVAREVRELGFFMTVGLMHDGEGQLDAGLVGRDRLPAFYEEMVGTARKSWFHPFGEGWERTMLARGQADWRCRAGARYLYVDEGGIVSYCSQWRGVPGVPLQEYSRAMIERHYHTAKPCASSCTIGCVRRASSLDQRRRQKARPPLGIDALQPGFEPGAEA